MTTSSKGFFLNQQKYILDLLQDVEILHAKPTITPVNNKLKLDSSSKPLMSFTTYQRIVDKLIYLTIIRAHITFVVSLLSQYMDAPTIQHFGMMKCILKGLFGYDIVMTHNGHTDIMGYTDSDWATNALDRRSTTRYCMVI